MVISQELYQIVSAVLCGLALTALFIFSSADANSNIQDRPVAGFTK